MTKLYLADLIWVKEIAKKKNEPSATPIDKIIIVNTPAIFRKLSRDPWQLRVKVWVWATKRQLPKHYPPTPFVVVNTFSRLHPPPPSQNPYKEKNKNLKFKYKTVKFSPVHSQSTFLISQFVTSVSHICLIYLLNFNAKSQYVWSFLRNNVKNRSNIHLNHVV